MITAPFTSLSPSAPRAMALPRALLVLVALLAAAMSLPTPAAVAAAASTSAPAATPQRATEEKLQLVMFEDESCLWCERFREEILPYYHKTEEGRRAPLRMVNIHAPRPPDLKGIRKVVYTPTFVLVDGRGRELGRIEGYPGEEFFWFRLQKLLKKAHDKTRERRDRSEAVN